MTNPANHTENRKAFFDRLEPVLSPTELLDVEVAYELAKHSHRAQFRKECDGAGQPLRYFEHPRRVALIAIDEVGLLDRNLIISCLMHDALEDTNVSAAMLEHLFGKEVCKTVKLVSKCPKEGYYDRLRSYGTELAVMVKMLDRMDNLRSMGDCSEEFKARQIRETCDVIIPLAYHHGFKSPKFDDARTRFLVQYEKSSGQR